MPGPLHEFLRRDHARLDALLRRTVEDERALDLTSYESFREGLLRHIAMEEKVLFREARAHGGLPPTMTKQLRADHAALAALMVPTPTREIVTVIADVLRDHDALEEDEGGVYDACERLIGADADAVLARLRAVPEVPVAPHVDAPHVHAHIANLLRARLRADARR